MFFSVLLSFFVTILSLASANKIFNLDHSLIHELIEYGPVAQASFVLKHPKIPKGLDLKLWFQVNISKKDPRKAMATIVRLDNVQEEFGKAMKYIYRQSTTDIIWRGIQGWTDGVEVHLSDEKVIIIPENQSYDSMQIELDNTFFTFKEIPKPCVDRQIPSIIHQITSNIKGEKMKVIEKTTILVQLKNQNYDHREYSLDEMPSLIEELEGERAKGAFEKLIPGAYKADLLRLILLKHFGGNYLDSKLVPLKAFDEILPKTGPFLCKAFSSLAFQNTLMSLPPMDPLATLSIDRIIKNVENNYYGPNPFAITGPKLIQDIHDENFLNYPSISRMTDIYTVIDDNDDALFIFHNGEYRRMQSLVPNEYYLKLWNERRIFV